MSEKETVCRVVLGAMRPRSSRIAVGASLTGLDPSLHFSRGGRRTDVTFSIESAEYFRGGPEAFGSLLADDAGRLLERASDGSS